MKKSFRRLTAAISALTVCISVSSVVSAEVTGAYIPEGLPVADGKTLADAETIVLLDSICAELKENVFSKFPDSEFHDVTADILMETSYVKYESTEQAELDAVSAYCKEHDISDSYVWLKHRAPVPAEEPESDDGKITDKEVIVSMINDFIREQGLFGENAKIEFETVGVYIWHPENEAAVRNFIKENNISEKTARLYVAENSLTPSFNAEAVNYGDINSDGSVDITDLSELSLALIGDIQLNENQQKAADVDGDGEVRLADLAKVRQFLSKQIDSISPVR